MAEAVTLRDKKIKEEVLRMIPPQTASFYRMLPFEKEGSLLKVAMVNPEDVIAKEALKFIAQKKDLKTEIHSISQQDFNKAFQQYADLREAAEEILTTLEREKVKEVEAEEAPRKEEALQRISQEAPISKMVAVILRHAAEGGASDIHIEPGEGITKVRFRVDGILHIGLRLPKRIHPAIVSRIKVLSELKIDVKRKPQDGRFRAEIAGKKIDFRISTFPTTQGEKVVLRLLDPEAGLIELGQLGLRSRSLKIVKNRIKEPYGMILITGPTGSGKTTTLYAILKILNQEDVNIVTLEDPVEYWIEGISQSQVKPEIGYTFAQGLRHILRQDPDIILVGEIRDQETAELAVHAALTGHLVLSTLHTNSAVGAVPRLIDMGVSSFLLPPSLNLVVAQRLVRKIEQREGWQKPTSSQKKILEAILGEEKLSQRKKIRLPQAKDYSGRIGIFEVLEMTPRLEKIIIEEPTESTLEKEAARQGMTTMKQDGIIKALEGVTTLQEVLKAVEE